ncbi:MAG: hypothetical protein M3451_06080, partial [Chloroflexota bacterium]|nr:hypothetical protein [Chloroflexota bacterium]
MAQCFDQPYFQRIVDQPNLRGQVHLLMTPEAQGPQRCGPCRLSTVDRLAAVLLQHRVDELADQALLRLRES